MKRSSSSENTGIPTPWSGLLKAETSLTPMSKVLHHSIGLSLEEPVKENHVLVIGESRLTTLVLHSSLNLVTTLRMKYTT